MPQITAKRPVGHARFIDRLGGPRPVVDLINSQHGLNLTKQTVSNWRQRGIPHRWRNTLAAEAARRGIAVPGDFDQHQKALAS